jgi:ubiquinone biosynthesis protein UbiJ
VSNALDDAVRQLDDAIAQLERAIDDYTRDDWIVIRNLGAQANQKLRDFAQRAEDLANVLHAADPINDRISKWSDVGNKTLALNKDVSGAEEQHKGIHGQEYWEGTSRNHYNAQVTVQQAAIGGLQTAASDVSASLNAMSTGLLSAKHTGEITVVSIAAFVLSVATALTGGTLIGLLGAVASAAGVIVTVNSAVEDLSDAQSKQAKALSGALDKQGDWPQPGVQAFDQDTGWVPAK